MSNLYVRPGFWVRTKDAVKGALDVRGAIREILKAINVAYSDDCCSPDPDMQPVRYNASNTLVEHFDGLNWSNVNAIIWDNINAKAQFQNAPVSATSPGSPGEIAFDDSYFYICTETDSWKRTAIAAW